MHTAIHTANHLQYAMSATLQVSTDLSVTLNSVIVVGTDTDQSVMLLNLPSPNMDLYMPYYREQEWMGMSLQLRDWGWKLGDKLTPIDSDL